MQQANDFLEENDVLFDLLQSIYRNEFDNPTQFKAWTINDILVHLYFWNMAADQALNAPEEFTTLYTKLKASLASGNLRQFENQHIKQRGTELLALWQKHYRDMGKRWANVDPKIRVKWAGPEMSTRSSMSARQMEVWAHGQAIFDTMGKDRPESDRIKNIVYLGVNSFGWSHIVRKMEVPSAMPRLELFSPSGEVWEFGEQGAGLISGSAVSFCQVVTQVRNIADTDLHMESETARTWMENAQCFAGPPETPPSPGARTKTKIT